jgi:hypothetical protein
MDYPATLDVTTPDRIANWRPLLQWLLALPHMIIAFALSYVAPAVAFIAWFAILFTGRLPEGLATLQVMILRYTTRAQLYQGFLFDKYPEFDFSMTSQEPGGSPVTLSVTPSLEGRNRLTVFFRLFTAIPAVIFAMLVGIVGAICWILGFFAVLFTGRWPEGLRRFVVKSVRVSVRTQAYTMLLTDQYPPFSLD